MAELDAETTKAEIAGCVQQLVQIAIDRSEMAERFKVGCRSYDGGGYELAIFDSGAVRGAFCFFPEIHDVDMLTHMALDQCRKYANG